jgi:hypothetical protein
MDINAVLPPSMSTDHAVDRDGIDDERVDGAPGRYRPAGLPGGLLIIFPPNK